MFENLSSYFSALGLGYLVVTAWPLAKTDFLEHRLPNKYVLPAFPITWLGQLLASVFANEYWKMLWAFVIAVVTFLIALGINRLGLLGMGDVKLMTVMALGLGWYSLIWPVIALGLTFLMAGIAAVCLLLAKKLDLGGAIPLGPYLLAGFLGAITLGVWS